MSNYTLIRTADMADSQVTTSKILDANVIAAKLAVDSVTTAKIVDANVTTAKLADAAVTTDKLGADAVTNAKLADNAVETANILDANVITAKIADLNVTTGKLADSAVTTLKIADANVTTAKLADDSVTAAKLADVTGVAMSQDGAGLLNVNYDDATVGVDGSDRLYVKDGGINTAQLAESAVANGKIAEGAVTTTKITDGNITTAKLADDAVTPAKLDLSANYAFEGSSTITVAAGGSISWATAPINDSQLANKAYVDSVANGLSWKDAARVATTGNIDLSAPGAAIDGVSLSNKDRVLVWSQTDASQNGVYIWDSASTAMTRATDMDEAAEFPSAALFVSAGTAWGDTAFVCTNDVAPTLGTTAIEFVQFTGAYQVIAGAGLTKTGNTLDVGAGDGIAADADAVRVRLAADAGVEFKSGEISAKVDTTRAMNVDANGLFVKVDATKGIGISGGGNLVTKFDANFGLSMDSTNGLRVDILAGGAMEFENGDLDVKDLGIDTARLAAGAVTTEKISDGAVTTDKLGADAVTNAKLADNAVETANIVDANVTTLKIADGAITLAKLDATLQGAIGGYDSSYDLEITSNGQVVALPATCPLTVPKHLLFVNGRLMRIGSGKDYTIASGNIEFTGGFVIGDTLQIVWNAP
jgi:trimeric autotransporter adhesin